MANYEYVDNVGTWFFHALIESNSTKLTRMTENEEANHQNKPRSCHQFESTFIVESDSSGIFSTITHLEPEYTVLLFGVHVLDSESFDSAVNGADGSEHFMFPTGAGIGPFLRPPVMTLCPSAFAIPDASNGRNWQTAVLAAATDETALADWLLVQIGVPLVASGVDNFKAGMALNFRIAGFDGTAPTTPLGLNTNYYVFWHVQGSVAAYS